MKIILQRGTSYFLVEHDEQLIMIETNRRERWPVKTVDHILKHGYCDEPHPTPEQLNILMVMLAQQ